VKLTPRETEVLQLLGNSSKSQKEIAKALNLSPKTIEAHANNIMRKLDIHSRAGLVLHVKSEDRQPQPEISPAHAGGNL
jgi:DNA-binding CsgD family transcriptional regulator